MSSLRLDFAAAAPHASDSSSPGPGLSAQQARTPAGPTLFPDTDTDLPPTWSEGSAIFHTWSKCTRLQSIHRNRRVTGNPGLREHCLNCISIAATHRRG